MSLLTPDVVTQDTDFKDDALCEVNAEHECLIFASWRYTSQCNLDNGYACDTAKMAFDIWASSSDIICEGCGSRDGKHWVWVPVGEQ